MDIFIYTDYFLILAFSIAITIYFTLRKIVCLKSILLLLSLGFVFLVLQLILNYFLVSGFGPFDSITLKETFMLKLGPDDRFMLMSYSMFISAIACSFVRIIANILGKDVGSGCSESSQSEAQKETSN